MIQESIQIHPSSFIDEGAQVGEETEVWHFTHIMSGAIIGSNCKIGQNVVVHPTAKVGNGVKIQNNVSIYDGVTLEDDVFCGPSCVFTNITSPRAAIARNSPEFYKRTLVKKGASIGANATIICGVTIGRYALIGAGSVVTKNVPDYALVYGNPAHVRQWVCECGKKIKFLGTKGRCLACEKQYILRVGKVFLV
jgi:UDP-2-acetamido-3-amino-2,3-dideoxy-glucuronate N-acetyltransferase